MAPDHSAHRLSFAGLLHTNVAWIFRNDSNQFSGTAGPGCLLISFHTQHCVFECFFVRFALPPSKSGMWHAEILTQMHRAMVSVPFHQIMRSTCPIFIILIYRVFYFRSYSQATYLSLIPIILGVALATYGDYYFTTLGFTLTLLGVILSALKTVMSNRVMTGCLVLPTLEVLLRLSPLAAFQSLLYAVVTGEAQAFRIYVADGNLTLGRSVVLAGNGLLAFVLNVASFHTNKMAGALTMTVCANVKQCMTILLGIVLFGVQIGTLNGYGILVTLAGAGIYSKVELDTMGKKEAGINQEIPGRGDLEAETFSGPKEKSAL